jgi:protein associated with RNAse G/E
MDSVGVERWRYEGVVILTTPTSIKLQAQYNNRLTKIDTLHIRPGDIFLETFFSDRWYNIFAIFNGDNRGFKGWYCNITRPASIEATRVIAEDLALDLVVYPDLRWKVLDEEEFAAIELGPEERARARLALEELIARVSSTEEPFNQSPSLIEPG